MHIQNKNMLRLCSRSRENEQNKIIIYVSINKNTLHKVKSLMFSQAYNLPLLYE